METKSPEEAVIRSVNIRHQVLCTCVTSAGVWLACRDGSIQIRNVHSCEISKFAVAGAAVSNSYLSTPKWTAVGMKGQGHKVWVGCSDGCLRAFSRDGNEQVHYLPALPIVQSSSLQNETNTNRRHTTITCLAVQKLGVQLHIFTAHSRSSQTHTDHKQESQKDAPHDENLQHDPSTLFQDHVIVQRDIDGKPLRQFCGHLTAVRAMCVSEFDNARSSADSLLWSGSDEGIRVWNMTGQCLAELKHGMVSVLTFVPTSAVTDASTQSNQIIQGDTSASDLQSTTQGCVWSAGEQGSIVIWNVKTRTSVKKILFQHTHSEFRNSGGSLLNATLIDNAVWACDGSDSIVIFSCHDGNILSTMQLQAQSISLVYPSLGGGVIWVFTMNPSSIVLCRHHCAHTHRPTAHAFGAISSTNHTALPSHPTSLSPSSREPVVLPNGANSNTNTSSLDVKYDPNTNPNHTTSIHDNPRNYSHRAPESALYPSRHDQENNSNHPNHSDKSFHSESDAVREEFRGNLSLSDLAHRSLNFSTQTPVRNLNNNHHLGRPHSSSASSNHQSFSSYSHGYIPHDPPTHGPQHTSQSKEFNHHLSSSTSSFQAGAYHPSYRGGLTTPTFGSSRHFGLNRSPSPPSFLNSGAVIPASKMGMHVDQNNNSISSTLQNDSSQVETTVTNRTIRKLMNERSNLQLTISWLQNGEHEKNLYIARMEGEIDRLQASLSKINQELRTETSTNEHLRQSHFTLETTFENTAKTVEEMKAYRKTLEESIQKQQDRIRELATENDKIRNDLDHNQREVKSNASMYANQYLQLQNLTDQKIAAITQDKREIQAQLELLDKDNRILAEKVVELETENITLKRNLSSTQNRLTQADARVVRLSEAKQTSDQTFKSIQSEVGLKTKNLLTTQSENNNLKERISALENQINDLKEDKQHLQHTVRDLEHDKENVENSLHRAEDALEILRDQYKGLKDNFSTTEANEHQLKTDQERYMVRISELEQAADENLTTIEKLRTEQMQLRADVDGLTRDTQVKDEQINRLQLQNSNTEMEKKEVESTLQELAKEKHELAQRLAHETGAKENVSRVAEDQSVKIQAYEAEITSLKAQVEALSAEYEDQQSAYDDLKTNFDRRISSVTKEKAQEEEIRTQIEVALENKTRECERLTQEIRDMEGMAKTRDLRIRELTDDLEGLQRQHQSNQESLKSTAVAMHELTSGKVNLENEHRTVLQEKFQMIGDLRAMQKELDTTKHSLEEMTTKHQDDIAQNVQRIETLKLQLDERDVQLAEVERRNALLVASNEANANRLSQQSERVMTLEAERNALEDKVDSDAATILVLEKLKASLEQTNKEFEQAKALAQSTCEDQATQIGRLRESKRTLEHQVSSHENTIRDLERQNVQYQRDVETLQQGLSEVENTVSRNSSIADASGEVNLRQVLALQREKALLTQELDRSLQAKRNAQDDVSRQARELKTLTLKLDRQTKRVGQLERSRLARMHIDTNNELRFAPNNHSSLRSSDGPMSERLRQLETEKYSLESSLDDVEHEKTLLDQECTQLRHSIDELQSKLSKAESQLSSVERERLEWKTIEANLASQLENVERAKTGLQSLVNELKSSLEEAQLRETKLEHKLRVVQGSSSLPLSPLVGSPSPASHNIRQLLDDKHRLSNDLSEKEGQIQLLQHQVSDLSASVWKKATLERNLKNAKDENHKLAKDIAALQERVREQDLSITDLRSKNSSSNLSTIHSEVERDISLSRKNEHLQEANQTLNDLCETLRARVQELESSKHSLEQELMKARQFIDGQSLDRQDDKELSFGVWSDIKSDGTISKASLQRQNNRLRQEISRLNTELMDTKQEYEELAERVKMTQRDVENQLNLSRNSQASLSLGSLDLSHQSSGQIDHLKEQVRQLETDRSVLETSNKELNKLLQSQKIPRGDTFIESDRESALKMMLERVRLEKEEALRSNQTLSEQVAELQVKVASLAQQVVEAQAECSSDGTLNQIKTLEETNKNLRMNLNQLDEKKQSLFQQVIDAEKKIATMQGEKTSTTERLRSLEEKIQDQSQQMITLRQEKSDADRQLSVSQAETAATAKGMSALRADAEVRIGELKNSNQVLQQSIERQRTEIRTLQASVERETEKARVAENRKQSLEDKVEEQTAAIRVLENLKASMWDSVVELEKLRSVLEGVVERQENTITRLKNEKWELQQRLYTYNDNDPLLVGVNISKPPSPPANRSLSSVVSPTTPGAYSSQSMTTTPSHHSSNLNSVNSALLPAATEVDPSRYNYTPHRSDRKG